VKRYWLVLGLIPIGAAALVYYIAFARVAVTVFPDEAIAIDGAVRHYRLVVPLRLPKTPAPIVFAFHGIGDSAEEMESYSGLDRLAANNGFLLVYPMARNHMWATMQIDPKHLDRNPDVRFFDQILKQLGRRFTIDQDAIYVTGMSNGATFAQVVAFARPSVAAVVAHSGPKPVELTTAVRPFPVLLLAGANDQERDGLRSNAAWYRAHGHAAELIIVPGLGHEWSSRHCGKMWQFLSDHKRTATP
jgi:polyhydroxybutyrate depolymerase